MPTEAKGVTRCERCDEKDWTEKASKKYRGLIVVYCRKCLKFIGYKPQKKAKNEKKP